MSRSPLTAVPAQRSSMPNLQTRRRLVLAGLGLAVVSGLFSGIAWLSYSPPASVTVSGTDNGAIALARTVAVDFLAGRASAVPGTKGVSTDFSVNQAGGKVPAGGFKVDDLSLLRSSDASLGNRAGSAKTVELEEFNALLSGRLFTVGVTMLQTPSGWVLASPPSLTPAQVGKAGDGDGIDYSTIFDKGVAASAVPPLVTAQVQKWAAAFASGTGLAEVVNDPTPGHTYSGLGGWTVSEVSVDGAVTVPGALGDDFILRVSLVLHPPGSNGPTLSSSYDLLVEPQKQPAAPPVTAWGPAGSYHSLTPYQNRMPG